MSLHRFFVPPTQIADGTVTIRGTEVWHITKVLRLSQGADIVVFDGKGHEYRVKLGRQKRQELFGTVLEAWDYSTESPLKLTLVQGIPKANKMDMIVQKATEIGVNDIIPLNSTRSEWNVKHKRKKDAQIHQRLDRWSRICIEAAKQSCRTAIPLIRPVVTVDEFLEQERRADAKMFVWEEETQVSLKQGLEQAASDVTSAIVVVGPEGGFTPREAEQFRTHEYTPVSLGNRILRTETAGLVVLGILQYVWGDY